VKGYKRVAIFGIDGGTWQIMIPLLKKGRLPTLSKLMENGKSAVLMSVMPPITASGWASFMTGLNPGSHGIFDFMEDIHTYGYDSHVPDSRNIKAYTIWELLSEAGKKLIVVGVPFLYPPMEINGVMISRSFTNHLKSYPPSLIDEIKKHIGYEYELAKPVDTFGEVKREEVLEEIIHRNRYLTEKIKDISIYLLKNYEWDFFMTHFMSTDTIQHYFWHFIDPQHPAHDPILASKYGDVIYRVYEEVDRAIGEILRFIDEKCRIFVISDHGFAPIYEFFHVNKWLEELGLLTVNWKNLYRWKPAMPTVHKFFYKAGLEHLSRIFPSFIRKLRIPALKRISREPWEVINWKETKAYASTFGININLKGREPSGIVNPGKEYRQLRDEIRGALYQLRDNAGRTLVERVFYREEIYTGPFTEEAADIFFVFKNPHYLQTCEVNRKGVFERLGKRNFATANHRYSPDGIFIASGPDISHNSGKPMEKFSLLDLPPTILYMLNLPIPKEMDGRVLTSIVTNELAVTSPSQFVEKSLIKFRKDKAPRYEDDEIKRHLKGLGYLG